MPGIIEDLCARRAGWATTDGAGDECSDGWRALLEGLFDDIAAVMASHPGTRLAVRQVKEKFGGLRFYYDLRGGLAGRSPASGAVEALAVEDRSLEICEACGGPGRLMVRRGWYHTRCALHAPAGSVPVAMLPPAGA